MGIDLEIDASVGIAVFPEHGADTDTLLRHADVALYLSKEAHAPSLYAEEHDHYSPERLALVTDLRRAVRVGGGASRLLPAPGRPAQRAHREGRGTGSLAAPRRAGCWARTSSSPWPSTPV